MVSSQVQERWWKSQALRFLLRWPSPYLCHLLNCHRHEAYGLHTADLVLRSAREAGEEGLGAWLAGSGGERPGNTTSAAQGRGTTGTPPQTGAQAPSQAPPAPRSLLRTAVPVPGSAPAPTPASSHAEASASGGSGDWQRNLGAREGQAGGAAGQAQRSQGHSPSQWSAYLPRPILSMHVRQGDKGREMEIIPFSRYMRVAEGLWRRTALRPKAEDLWRRSTQLPLWLTRWLPGERPSAACLLEGPTKGGSECRPELSTIWLTTEMQVRLPRTLSPLP